MKKFVKSLVSFYRKRNRANASFPQENSLVFRWLPLKTIKRMGVETRKHIVHPDAEHHCSDVRIPERQARRIPSMQSMQKYCEHHESEMNLN